MVENLISDLQSGGISLEFHVGGIVGNLFKTAYEVVEVLCGVNAELTLQIGFESLCVGIAEAIAEHVEAHCVGLGNGFGLHFGLGSLFFLALFLVCTHGAYGEEQYEG